MRGLVVVVALILLASVLLGNITTAETKKETTVLMPAAISCVTTNGTHITFKANTEVKNLKIDGICEKERVPAGWSMQCYTSDIKNSIYVSFETDSGEKRSRITCG